MEADLSRRIFILRREYLFQGLDSEQLSRVANTFDERRVVKDTFIFSQGDAPDNFYIVIEGQVKVLRQEGKQVRQLNILGPGSYFGEQALLFNNPRSASVQAATDVLLLCLTSDQFDTLLKDYPDIRLNLAATADSRKLVHRITFPWQESEEVIYYVTRKHPLFLFISLTGPAVTAFLGLLTWGLLGAGGGFGTATIVLLVLFVFIAGWVGWDYLDWSNDYYIVTNQRVVYQEKVVLLYDSRDEAPLNTVLSVNITTSWWGRRFDFGDVEIRTYTGNIMMRRMSKPYLFASFVEGYKRRIQAISKEQENEEIGKSLRVALLKSKSPAGVSIPAEDAPKPAGSILYKPPPPAKQESFIDDLRKALQTFLKVRYQEGKVITYRKHYLLLLRQAGVPFFLTLLSFFGIGWAIFARQYLFVVLLVVFFLIVFAWLLYGYVDWSNDIYRLTPEQIMDIEKKPLGRENKKTSNLDAPDFRVEHIRKNFINILFNFGDVIVSIGQTKFTFDGVYNPDQVHQDVANYRAAFQRRKVEEESKRDHDRMVKWLVAYHQQAELLEKPEKPDES